MTDDRRVSDRRVSDLQASDDGGPEGRILARLFRLFVIVAVIALVLAGGFGIALSRFSTQLDKLDTSTRDVGVTTAEARDAAVKTRKALEDALASAQQGTVNSQAVIDALAAIHRIEVRLCGGPCPDPGG